MSNILEQFILASDDDRTGEELIIDDTVALTGALHDVRRALIALRPAVTDTKYTVWQRAMRTSEDALRIHPTERYTQIGD